MDSCLIMFCLVSCCKMCFQMCLNYNQKTAADWFLNFVLMSLEGVEFHQGVEEGAETREEMILSLRYRNEGEKLANFSPLMVRLWTRILGNWLIPTSGGCRCLVQAREWFLHQIAATLSVYVENFFVPNKRARLG